MNPASLFFLGLALYGAADDARYVDATLEPEGEILSARFLDVDLTGTPELVLALRREDGGRELRFHRLRGTTLEPDPFRTVEVLRDVVAWTLADVRPDPGRELLFLTRGGVYSYSLEKEGYAGNLERLVSEELIYDVPDPYELPYWSYVFEGPRGEWLLVPTADALVVWSPGDEEPRPAEATYRLTLPPEEAEEDGDDDDNDTRVSIGPGGFRIEHRREGLPDLFLTSDVEADGLLEHGRSTPAPAVVDVDGNGHPDLLRRMGESLHVHLADGNGRLPAAPTRVEAFPEWMRTEEDDEQELTLHDFDGDGRTDLLVKHIPKREDFGNGKILLRIVVNDGQRLLAEKPTQELRFEGAEVRVHVTDVDGDGRVDLALRKFELPSLLGTVSGIEFKVTHLLHLGEKGRRPFARKPEMKVERSFDESSLTEAIRNRRLELDCSGDGIADLVEIDPQGRIAIRRIVREKSFFGGTSWDVEPTPYLRFDTWGDLSSIEVEDLNGDGLGDVVSVGSEALTLLLSDRR